MNCEKLKRRLSLFLCALMVLGTLVGPMSVFADEEDPADAETAPEAAVLSDDEDISAEGEDVSVLTTGSATVENGAGDNYTADYDEETLKKLLDAKSYREYLKQFEGVPAAGEDFTILAVDAVNEELTTAEHSVMDAGEVATDATYG